MTVVKKTIRPSKVMIVSSWSEGEYHPARVYVLAGEGQQILVGSWGLVDLSAWGSDWDWAALRMVDLSNLGLINEHFPLLS